MLVDSLGDGEGIRPGATVLVDGLVESMPLYAEICDENMGGPYGNTHLAVGHSYQASYDGGHFQADDFVSG